jgi:type II secretory pathway component GspD/PulD (secretin)
MGQLWNLSGRTALATLAGLAVLEGTALSAPAPPRSGGTAPSPPAAVANGSGRVSVDFVDADLGDIAKALLVQTGTNVILAGDVSGKVTVSLKGTTLEEALRLITSRLNNVDFKRMNGAYVIGTPDALRTLAKRSGTSATVTPRSLSLTDARDAAQSASPYVDVEIQNRTGQLVLRGLPDDVAAARAAVETADTSTAAARVTRVIKSARLTPKALSELLQKTVPELQCSVRELGVIVTGTNAQLARADEVVRNAADAGGFPMVTRLYQLKYITASTAANLFTNAGAQSAASGGGSGGEASGGTSLHQGFPHLAVSVAPEGQAPAAPTFKPLSLDSSKSFNTTSGSTDPAAGGAGGGAAGSGGAIAVSPKARALILMGPEDEVMAATALLDQVDVAPVQVMIEARVVESSPESFKNIGLQWDFGTTGIVELPHGPQNPSFGVGVITRPPFNFQATINALIQNTNSKVLADPKIAVLDGEDASIFIGDTIRYRVLSSVSTGGQQVFDVKEVPVGIVLLCRPRVNSDGMVTMKVNPVVSTITSFVGPEQLPQTASREASSTIRVKDGDTIVIGGLIQDQDRQVMSRVPILGSLPIVGQLFRNNNHDRKRTDVTIFLTTHVLKG